MGEVSGAKWPPRWSWRRKITATVSRRRRCCASKPAAYVCRRPTSVWPPSLIFTRRLSICAATRRYSVIAGTVGCFGGMSIAAALCSYLIVTVKPAVWPQRPAGYRAGPALKSTTLQLAV